VDEVVDVCGVCCLYDVFFGGVEVVVGDVVVDCVVE